MNVEQREVRVNPTYEYVITLNEDEARALKSELGKTACGVNTPIDMLYRVLSNKLEPF